MDLLVKKDNIKAVRKALSILPRTLDSTYEEAIQRIHGQGRESAKRAIQILSWLTYALRPLSLVAMQHALAVETDDDDDDEDLEEFDEDAVPDEDTLASVCAGLVTVERENQTIQLAHYTTQEYLRELKLPRFLAAQTIIATTSLRYLSLSTFANGPCPSDNLLEGRMRGYPFLEYAARHWGDHTRSGADEKVNNLALTFLQNNPKVAASVQVMHLPAYRRHGYSQHFPRNLTGLHLAAFFGLGDTISNILSTGTPDIDAQDSNGRTALSLVAEKGYAEAATPLFGHNADASKRDNRGWTPLHWACKEGRDAMVRCLLLHAPPGQSATGAKDKQGATPLYWAAEKGHSATVRLLIEHGAEINLREGRGTTPLQGAASSGHVDVVRLLLENGAHIDAQDDYFGRTALHRAAGGGHVAVLELLLSHGAAVDAVNNWNRTALHRAAGAGREAVVRVLLKYKADVSLKDTVQGATALHVAADGGHTSVADLLVEEGADVKSRNDEKGATPLHWAARRGHEKTVRRLVELGAEIGARDNNGMTALHEAAANGRTGVVRVLLGSIAIGSKDDRGATPLHWAAAGGHDAVAGVLLEKGADAKAVDNSGRTALHYAAEAKNTSGTNALHLAARDGDLVVMQALLADGVDVNSRDSTGATALHWAAAWGREPAVRLLLESGVEVMGVDGYGWTALHRAANDRHGGSSRHEAATWLLLEKVDAIAAGTAGDGVEKTEPSRKMLAPLPNAATPGHAAVARLLLAHGADAEVKDGKGLTAMDEAAQSGHDAMVLLLLQRQGGGG